MLVYLLGVDVLAAVLGLVVLGRTSFDGQDFRLALFLTVLGVTFEEGVRRAARLKMRLSADLKRDMTSVWTVATAVTLPTGYAAAAICVISGYVWLRQHQPTGHPLHRGAFNVALNVLAVIGAAGAVHAVDRRLPALPAGSGTAVGVLVAVLVAMAVYTAINRVIPSVALVLDRVPMRELLASRNENLIEVATLSLGGLVAVVAATQPWLCVLAIAPLVALQRGALVAELEIAATRDGKTGLFNGPAWEHVARKELARAERAHEDVAVLVVDIDRFKEVNDGYGHLAGDRVLRAVGRTLEDNVREYDTVGRFGGEEFVVVLPDADEYDALVVAERLRAQVQELRMSTVLEDPLPVDAPDPALAVSVGVACFRRNGTEVRELVAAADAAMYDAKAQGRNCVALARSNAVFPMFGRRAS
jgi:diguanylate cyclase (GGDEF)-like protein